MAPGLRFAVACLACGEQTPVEALSRADVDVWTAWPLLAIVCGTLALFGLMRRNRRLQHTMRRGMEELSTASARHAAQAEILAQVTDAIVTTDRQMRVTTWNAGAGTLFGIPEDQALGHVITSLITDRMASPRGGDWHEAIDSGTDWRGDAEIVRPFGDTRFIETTVRGVVDSHGHRTGTIVLARDVDARRRAEIDAGIRARQQAVVASLGQRALAGIDFQLLIEQATSLALSTLEVSATAVLQLADDRRTLYRRAGAGWASDGDQDLRIPVDTRNYPARALVSDSSAVTLDHRDPNCPPVDAFHVREGITAGAAIAIPGTDGTVRSPAGRRPPQSALLSRRHTFPPGHRQRHRRRVRAVCHRCRPPLRAGPARRDARSGSRWHPGHRR